MNPETEDDVRRREADRLLAAAIYLHAARGGVGVDRAPRPAGGRELARVRGNGRSSEAARPLRRREVIPHRTRA
jgi:hypothetical protein